MPGLKSVRYIRAAAKGDKIIAQINKLNPAIGLEVFDFVFDVKRQYNSPYLQEYVAVRDDFANGTVNLTHQTNLPIEVLIGFNNYYQRGLNIPALISAANISTKQKIQLEHSKTSQHNTMELNSTLMITACLTFISIFTTKKICPKLNNRKLKENSGKSRRYQR